MPAKVGNRRRTERSAGKSGLGRLALVSLSGMALLTGLLFLAAVICLRRDASGWALPLAAYLCCAVSAFPVGCFAAKAVGKSGLLCGLLCALPLCILLLILCLALYGRHGFSDRFCASPGFRRAGRDHSAESAAQEKIQIKEETGRYSRLSLFFLFTDRRAADRRTSRRG